MESKVIEKKMSSTNHQEKIFNVRRIHYKQFDQEKYLKPHFSSLPKKQPFSEHPSYKMSKKNGQYNLQMALVSSGPYKEMVRKISAMKEEQSAQKQRRLDELRERDDQLAKFSLQNDRLQQEREKLMKKRDDLRQRITQIRDRNQTLRGEQAQRNQEYRFLNMQNLRDMIISMRYQNGVDIDPDRMTYQELLQLQQRMGSVSKGLSEDFIKLLPKRLFVAQDPPQLCSICYDDVKLGELITRLPCDHAFHFDCIKVWLLKEKACPMCKREVIPRGNSQR